MEVCINISRSELDLPAGFLNRPNDLQSEDLVDLEYLKWNLSLLDYKHDKSKSKFVSIWG